MSDRYPGGIITKTPVTPAGPYAEGAAPGVWTLEQQAYWQQQGLWPNASNPTPNDPYFQYVTSLLHGDGTNGGQNNTFLDSSSNAFTITRNGNTTQGSFSPYGSNWGNYFNGSSYLTTPSSITLGSGDLTIEGWISPANTSGTVWYDFRGADSGSAGNNPVIQWSTVTSGKFTVRIDGTNAITSSGTFSVGAWYHVALVRSGTTVTLYVNGISQGAYTTSTNFATAYVRIGAYGGDGTLPLTGYSSNLRAVVGTAVYTSNFTPSTTPLTAISGTQLLTCQSNRFIDNSSNAFAITVTSTPQVTRFSPFAPTYSTQYSASTIGGSGYFDGSGDYLSFTGSSIGASDDIRMDFWVYPNASISSGNYGLFASSDSRFGMITVSGVLYMLLSSDLNTGVSLPLYQWSNVVITRTSGTLRVFLNGTQIGSTSNSQAVNGNWRIASDQNNEIFPSCYMSDVRLLIGTGGTSVTVPTSPLTAITNTNFLCNMTNAAIYDNAMIPDYETVGNAQISTSVKKYGTGSLAFDGTGDYLLTDAPDSEFAFGTGNFTIEMWVYLNSVASYKVLYDGRPTGTVGAYNTIYLNSGTLIYEANNAARITGTTLSTGVWYHIAVCRAGTSTKMFVNGTQVGSTYSDSTTYLIGTQRPVIGADGTNLASNNLNGYIDDLRITKGYARYWENFTPPAAALPNFGGAPQIPTQDPQFPYTTMLLSGNGTNGAQNNTFLDSSTNAFTITRNGNTTQGTFTPYGSNWGTYFGGTNSYCTLSSNASMDFGTGDFTIEAWVFTKDYSISAGASRTIIGNSGNSYTMQLYIDTTSGRLVFGNTGSTYIQGSSSIANGQWTHVAITRSGTTARLFVNGTLEASGSNSQNYTSGTIYLGAFDTSNGFWNGYISNLRIVKGTAVYTSNFTPSTTPLTAVTNTALLTFQSNRFIDNSSNTYTVTPVNSPSVQRFSPFSPTASYSAATIGGSGYFDGTGDYLSVADNTALQLLSGDFTIECWVYLNEKASGPVILSKGYGGGTFEYLLFCNGTNFVVNIGGGSSAQGITGTTAVQLNTWYYVAVTRTSGTARLFVNGVQEGSKSLTSTNAGSDDLTIGGGNGYYTTGYICDVRLIKGTGGTSVTVPTAPLTAVTNTSLLCNFTNAGITDSAEMNDPETVSNTQISTAQSKFGGSSVLFNGSSDYLKFASSPNISFGSGDFTVEAWVYINSTTSYMTLMASYPYHQNGISTVAFRVGTSGTYASWTDGGGTPAASLGGLSWSTGVWYHVAWCRYNGVVTMYRNGASVGTVSDSTNFSVGGQTIGADFDAGSFTNGFNGYVDDFRITKGYARYVQPFTPPTQAFQTY